jgi:hypothetical protein
MSLLAGLGVTTCLAAGDAPPSAPLPEPETGSLGTPQTWQDYSFIPPPGWTTQIFPDGVFMQAPPTQQTGESTFIAMMPLRKAEGDLANQALAIVRGFFAQKFIGYVSYIYGHQNNLLEQMERGVTGDGWRFVEVNLSPILQDGKYTTHLVRVLLIQVGNQVAPVIAYDNGIRLDNPVSGKGAWPLFYFGLTFPKLAGPGPGAAYDQLVGTWGAGGTNSMLEETFGKEGAYSSMAGHQTYHDISSTQVLERTRGWFGEGRYVVQGNRLTVWSNGGKPATHYFRLAEQSNSAVPSGWIWKLRQLNRSIDGQNYEFTSTRH